MENVSKDVARAIKKEISRRAYAARKRAGVALHQVNVYFAQVMDENIKLKAQLGEIDELKRERDFVTTVAQMQRNEFTKEIEHRKAKSAKKINELTIETNQLVSELSRELFQCREKSKNMICELTKELATFHQKYDQLTVENQSIKSHSQSVNIKTSKQISDLSIELKSLQHKHELLTVEYTNLKSPPSIKKDQVYRVQGNPEVGPPISLISPLWNTHNQQLSNEVNILMKFRNASWNCGEFPLFTISALEHFIHTSTDGLSLVVAHAKLFREYEKNGTPTHTRFPHSKKEMCRAYQRRNYRSIQNFEMNQLNVLDQPTKKLFQQELTKYEIYDYTKFNNFAISEKALIKHIHSLKIEEEEKYTEKGIENMLNKFKPYNNHTYRYSNFQSPKYFNYDTDDPMKILNPSDSDDGIGNDSDSDDSDSDDSDSDSENNSQ